MHGTRDFGKEGYQENILLFLLEKQMMQVLITVLQLGFEGRGVLDRALFALSYKNEGTMCHVMSLVSRLVTKYV